MKVLLICKGEYRYFFPAIAHALKESYACQVCAVTFTTPATRMIEKSGVFDEVFNLAAYLKERVPNSDAAECLTRLQEIEFRDCTSTLNTMVSADRIVSRYPFEETTRIMSATSQFWEKILHTTQPDAILGEIACAAEWLAWTHASRMRIEYLAPYPTPVGDRFFFIDSPRGVWRPMERLYHQVKKRGLSPKERLAAAEFVENFRQNKRKPPFLKWGLRSPWMPNLRVLANRAARIPFRIQTYLEDGPFEIGSYHGTSPLAPLWQDGIRLLRHSWSESTLFTRRIEDGPKVYFPLHVQPEFTTDVRAPFFTNQIALVEAISKSVPFGCRVLVKEHPGMKGERNLGYYRKLKKLHNVRLFSPSVDSHDLIRESDLVLTIAGSSAWEAMLYEKPVIAFGRLPYGFYELVYSCHTLEDLPKTISDAVHNFTPNYELLLTFVWSLLGSAFELEWGDPIRNPSVCYKSNVGKIAQAIMSELSLRTSSSLSEAVLTKPWNSFNSSFSPQSTSA